MILLRQLLCLFRDNVGYRYQRACNLKLMGSGQGSVSTAGIVEELPALAREVDAGNLAVDAEQIPLADVETAWNAPIAPGRRLVFVP